MNILKVIFENGTLNADFTSIYSDIGEILEPLSEYEIVVEPSQKLRVYKRGNKIYINHSNQAEFFRGLSIALQNRRLESYDIENNCPFNRITYMADCSRNGVLNFDGFKKLCRILAFNGYTSLQLYMEDTYEVENEPYFGHLRGRYSVQELKQMESYAEKFGLELVPSIQTLAHLENIFIWPCYEEHIWDIKDILLVGEDRTYKLIDNMFKSLRTALKTTKIHIGFDEAHLVGRGIYMNKHGYTNHLDLLLEHLKKVLAIAEKYGFTCSMWSDMFFSLCFGGEYYVQDDKKELPREVLEKLPKNVELVYWDYYHTETSLYERMMRMHQKFPNNLQFASGAWKWLGYAPMNEHGIARITPGIKSAKKMGVKDVILTAWGDNGNEASFFSVLPQITLFAEYCYSDRVNKELLKARMLACTGCHYDDFLELDTPNFLPGEGKEGLRNPSKYFVYSDPLLGLFDVHATEKHSEHFAKTAKRLHTLAKRNNNFGYIFEMESKLCAFLAVKANIGNVIRAAYLDQDREALARCADKILPNCIKRLKAFTAAVRTCWLNDCKPFGLDVLQLRFGGQKERLNESITRIKEYLSGNINSIEELEQKRLTFRSEGDGEGIDIYKHNYMYMATPNFRGN